MLHNDKIKHLYCQIPTTAQQNNLDSERNDFVSVSREMNLASWEAVWAANSARRAANSARRVSDSALETMCPFCTQICVPAGNWSNRGPVSLSPPLLPAPSPFTLVDAPFFSPLERYWPSLFPLLNSFLSEYIIIKKYLCTMCANNSDSTLNKLCL